MDFIANNSFISYLIITFSIFAILFLSFRKPKKVRHNISFIDHMNGHDFEHYCGSKILKPYGFSSIKVTKGSGDFGVDIVAKKDSLLHVFQIKRYKGRVGVAAIQEIIAGKEYYRANMAYVITNSFFTNQAIHMAKRCNVVLIDRNNFYNNVFFS